MPYLDCSRRPRRCPARVETLGRKSGGKVVRVNPRFPESTAKRLKQASATRGQSVAAFILETVSREAELVLAEERYLRETVKGHFTKGVSISRVLVERNTNKPKPVLGFFTLTSTVHQTPTGRESREVFYPCRCPWCC